MLYIISTPIGNKLDISQRAITCLKQCSELICESLKSGRYWQKKYCPNTNLILLNEHSSFEHIYQLAEKCLLDKNIGLICDGGTPVFQDPGRELISLIADRQKNNFEVQGIITVPGASSLMAALSMCPFNMNQFFYAGFLNRTSSIRKREIKKYLTYKKPIVLLDTPYRLSIIISELNQLLPKSKLVFLGMDISSNVQKIIIQPINKIYMQLKLFKKKKFVLIIDN